MSRDMIVNGKIMSRYSPFKKPNWRFERVLEMLEGGPAGRLYKCTIKDDKIIKTYKKFLLKWINCRSDRDRSKLFSEHPALYLAHSIKDNATEFPELEYIIQARLLAGQTFEEIANYLGTKPEVIEWYSKLFFDVCDKLNNKDWITMHVLYPALERYRNVLGKSNLENIDQRKAAAIAEPFWDATLKILAYFGGPKVADLVINNLPKRDMVMSDEQLEEWMDKTWQLIIKKRSLQTAIAFPVNKYNSNYLLSLHENLISIGSRKINEKILESINNKIEKVEKDSKINEKSEKMLDAPEGFEEHIRALLDDIGSQFEDIKKSTSSLPNGESEKELPAYELKDDEIIHNVIYGEKLTKLPEPRSTKINEIVDKFMQ